MKKETLYLLEYLCKSEKNEKANVYKAMADALELALLYVPSSLTRNKIKTLMHHNGYCVPENFEAACKRLDGALEEWLPPKIAQLRKTILQTLLASNFPQKKGFLNHSLALFESQLEPVEKSIYQNLMAYIMGLNRALSLFCLLQEKSEPEELVHFAQNLHVKLMALVFHEEEKELLQKGLGELMGVYVSVYGKYLYEKRAK